MKTKIIKTVPHYLWRSVVNEHNSKSTAKLSDLDWSKWWTGGGFLIKGIYLHVPHKDGDSVHRVFCRDSKLTRLGWRHGKLWWIFPRTKMKLRR